MTHLRAGRDDETLLLRLLAGGDDAAAAGRIDRRRFFHEDVLARLDGRLHVHGPEQRRCRNQHDLGVGRQKVEVGFGAGETALFGHFEAFCRAQRLSFEVVGQGHDLHLATEELGGREHVADRAGAAAAATDQPDLETPALDLVGSAEDHRAPITIPAAAAVRTKSRRESLPPSSIARSSPVKPRSIIITRTSLFSSRAVCLSSNIAADSSWVLRTPRRKLGTVPIFAGTDAQHWSAKMGLSPSTLESPENWRSLGSYLWSGAKQTNSMTACEETSRQWRSCLGRFAKSHKICAKYSVAAGCPLLCCCGQRKIASQETPMRIGLPACVEYGRSISLGRTAPGGAGGGQSDPGLAVTAGNSPRCGPRRIPRSWRSEHLHGDCPNFRGHRLEELVNENGTVPLNAGKGPLTQKSKQALFHGQFLLAGLSSLSWLLKDCAPSMRGCR